jgi:hypothetical protein
MGGIALGLELVTLEDAENAPCRGTSPETQHSRAPRTLTLSAKDKESKVHLRDTNAVHSLPKASPFWYQHPGFKPDPRAPFKSELGRLCKHVGARTKHERRALQSEALKAEITYHYGASMSRLDRWQGLCEEVGIEKIPTSISQCQKVRTSLTFMIRATSPYELQHS